MRRKGRETGIATPNPMSDNRNIAAAIEACYDAAFEFRQWPAALQMLAHSLGATSCVIRTCDPTHPFRSDQRSPTALRPDSTEHAEFAALWIERIEGAPDPHERRPRKRLAKLTDSFVVEDEITTRDEREVLPYYQEIARPGDREWWAAIDFMVKDRRWMLSMFRDAHKGPFYRNEAEDFLAIVPSMVRIISAAERVWETAVEPNLAILDRMGSAALLLNCRGRVTRYNKHAEALLGTGLVIHGGRLRAADRPSDSRLQKLIAGVVSQCGDLSDGEPVLIAREGSPWLLAEAIPMTSFVHDLFNGGDALLYFTDLVAEPALPKQLIRHAFQLTAAETRLACRLADGRGIGAASSALGIGRETARTQLRAIFSKTSTGSQAELAKLLSRYQGSSTH